MRLFIFAILFLSNSLIWANEITVGEASIQIPTPRGFSPVTTEMKSLYEFQKQFVHSINYEFLTFIANDSVEIALNDQLPDLNRRFTVQTSKNLIDATITKTDFFVLKNTIKNQNNEIVKKAKAQSSDHIKKINGNMKRDYDRDLELSISKMTPLPIHEETDRSFAYSTLVAYDMIDEEGNPAPFVAVSTATFLHIRGKILFLYSYGTEADLEWTRKVSHDWSKEVAHANPSDFTTSIKEVMPPWLANIDLGESLINILIGAITGLLAFLMGWWFKRKEQTSQ